MTATKGATMQRFLIANPVRRALTATTAALITTLTLASATPGQAQTPQTDSTAVAGVGSTIALAASAGAVHLVTTGVSFKGSYEFLPTNDDAHHGGFHYQGSLCDTSADGNPVFVHATADGFGYGPRTYERGGRGHCRDINMISYQLDTPYTKTAKIQVCQDRGIFSDLCATSTTYHR
jgi:hypothetical protein